MKLKAKGFFFIIFVAWDILIGENDDNIPSHVFPVTYFTL